MAVIISVQSKEEFFPKLELLEKASGKGKRKWHRNSEGKRRAYITKLFDQQKIEVAIYYQIFNGPDLSYELATIQATANAIKAYTLQKNIQEYKATIVIDGLHRSLQGHTAKLLRNLGIHTKSVRGERDEVNPAIRLADAIAGFIRQAYEGDSHFKAVRTELEQKGTIERIP